MVTLKNPDTGQRIELTKDHIEEIRTLMLDAKRKEQSEFSYAGMRLSLDDAKRIITAAGY